MYSGILQQLELLLGSVGVIMSMFFGTFLLVTFKNRPKANLFLSAYLIALGLRICKALFFNYYPIDPQIRNLFLALLLTVGPSVWFYVRDFIAHDKVIRKKLLFYHYFPFILMVCLFPVVPNDGKFYALLIFTMILIHMAVYTSATLIWLLNYKKHYQPNVHLNNKIQWAFFFISITIVMILCFTASFLYVIPYLSNVFVFSIGIVSLSIWGLNNPKLFEKENKKYANSALSVESAKYQMSKLTQLMQIEEPFLDSELSLAILSEQLDVTPKHLSQIINQFEKENYSQYITRYRIEKAKELLSSPKYELMKIATIAYECGFNSISSFNTAFKNLQGETASQYRKKYSVRSS